MAYANGYGVIEDDVEAVKWYRKAADQGDATAQYNLGVMYKNGHVGHIVGFQMQQAKNC